MTRHLLTTLALFALTGPTLAAPRDPVARLRVSPVSAVLWRGRAPYRPSQLEALRQMGFKTILDMRGNQPFASALERRMAENHGLTYIKVPMLFPPTRNNSAERVVAAIMNNADNPMFVHCNVDKDRTSVAIGLYRIRAQGWSAAAAEAEAKQFGLRRVFVGLNRYLRSAGQ
jgi:protein tyrosine/serine phosphatase